MKRRDLLAGLAGTALLPGTLRAQKAMPVIGFLGIGSPESDLYLGAFRQGLSEAGYVEGRNLRVEYRWAEGKPERFPSLAADQIALKVDVIVTAGGTLAAMAAKRATTTLPIILHGCWRSSRGGPRH